MKRLTKVGTPQLRFLGVVTVFVAFGLLALYLTHAAQPNANIKPATNPTISQPVTTCTGTANSSGGCIQFGGPTPPPTSATLAVVGDIAWVTPNYNNKTENGSDVVANLIANTIKPDGVVTLGDHAYTFNQGFQYISSDPVPTGACHSYLSLYYPKWGQFLSKEYPVIGDHEYYYNNAQVVGGTTCDRTEGKTLGDPAEPFWDYYGNRINSVADVLWPGTNPAGSSGNFNSRQGYYSFNVGGWHMIVLNSICSAVGGSGAVGSDRTTQLVPKGCGIGSPQYNWLQSDLQKNSQFCTAAFWHYPEYQSGVSGGPAQASVPVSSAGGASTNDPNSDASIANADILDDESGYAVNPTTHMATPNAGTPQSDIQPLVNLLFQYHADYIFNGHSHFYEHLKSLNPSTLQPDPNGLESFVVGTGGAAMGTLNPPFSSNLIAHSSGSSRQDFGALQLNLNKNGGTYKFVGVDASSTSDVNDSGNLTCHN